MIAFVNAVRAPIKAVWVRRLLTAAAALPPLEASLPPLSWSVNVRLAGDREVRRLNSRFAGDDHATDVLSFESGDVSEGFLGDVVISWPAVLRQSDEFGHAPEAEFALLAVHGFLHLLGWDHVTAAEERAMNRLTVMALTREDLALGPRRLLTAGPRG